MAKNSKTATLGRLKRIEGQVRGLARMVEDERYCIDIVTQISAVRAALLEQHPFGAGGIHGHLGQHGERAAQCEQCRTHGFSPLLKPR